MTPFVPSTPMTEEISTPPDASEGDYVRISGLPYRIVDGRPVALHPSIDVEAMQSANPGSVSPSPEAASGPRNPSTDVPQSSEESHLLSTGTNQPAGAGSASMDFSSSTISDLRHMANEAGVDITGLRTKKAIADALRKQYMGPIASTADEEE